VPRFLAFLATRSIVSSVDVARRALGLRIAIDPAVFEYRTTLSAGRAALAALVTLLPGTLVVKLDGDRLLVHALASATAARAEIQELEGHLTGLFGTERNGDARAV
jgi:multicomponent Na+:H+ antiporter subunit E